MTECPSVSKAQGLGGCRSLTVELLHHFAAPRSFSFVHSRRAAVRNSRGCADCARHGDRRYQRRCYDKLYNEAADEWRRDTTLEESKATFERLREKLGRATVRSLQTAREEQTGTAPVAGHSLIAIYQTSFERGHAMETFTLVERGGKWYLAKYFVSSTALK